MVLHRLKSSELHCIKLSRVSLYNAWKQFLGRGYLKLSVVLFHTMTFHFFFFRMSWCSINQFTLLSIYLAYFSQLIKGFVLFPLHPVLYVKVGSSSCYLYMRQILAQWRNYCKNQAGSHKKKMDCYRISLRYISVIFFFIDEWHTCRIFVVLHYLLYICIYM